MLVVILEAMKRPAVAILGFTVVQCKDARRRGSI
jgi:hypothetical protein